jgi:hypothetical protein
LNPQTDLVKIAGQPTQEVEMHIIKHKIKGQPATRFLMSISYVGNARLPSTTGFIGDDASAR